MSLREKQWLASLTLVTALSIFPTTALAAHQDPDVDFSCSSKNVVIGQEIVCDAGSHTTIYDTDQVDSVTYTWNYYCCDHCLCIQACPSGPVLHRVYREPGRHRISVTVTVRYDDDTEASASAGVYVTVTSPPTAEFSFSPRTGTVGAVVTFDASESTDEDGDIEEYEWTFHDDMSTASGVTATHVFNEEGRFRVVLEVTDKDGNTSDVSEWITVSAPPEAVTTPDPPSSISTPSTTPTITIDPTTQSDYVEDFSGSTTDWSRRNDDDAVFAVTGGRYSMQSVKEGWFHWAWAPASAGSGSETFDLDEFTVAVDLTMERDSTGQGFLLWGTGNDNFYIFRINSDAEYSLGWQKDDAWQSSPISTSSHASVQGVSMTNRIRVVVQDGHIALYCNDVHLKTVISESFDEGYIGLGVGLPSSESSPAHVFFDNFEYSAGEYLRAPEAEFSQAPATSGSPSRISFNAAESTDPDGSILSYAWDFGDGSTGSGLLVTHEYQAARSYIVKLTVTDDDGLTDSMSHMVYITGLNALPYAFFTWQARSSDGTRVIVEPRPGDGVQFDASGSNDEDGEIAEYAWDWDDDGTYDETTLEPVIDYWFETPGSHVVTLCVTDDQGATDTTIRTVVIVAEQPPTAAFSYDPAFLSVLDVVQFTDLSYDEDGEVTSWTWDFGDGTASTEASPTHQYASKGTFTVTLRVTDDDGLLSTVAQTVEIVNLDPLATFTLTPEAAWTKQPIHLDASASSDPDGTIVAYEWDFDDDGAADASGATVETQYADAGTHTIRLYVTDEDGGTAAKEIVVTVEELSIVEPQEVWALVIGISDYEDPNVTDLAYARADAEAFATWLVDSGTDPDHVFLLLDENGETAEGIAFREATLSKIRAGLDWLYRMAHPEDLVFVYFAGHGFQSEDDDGDETDGVDEFLVPYDVDTQARSATALRDDEFGKFLDDIESNHVMVVFDSCHSGGQSRSLSGGTRPMGDEFDLFNDFSLEGKLVMAAAAENQKALEHEAFGHGVFTYFLLQGLEGGADQDVDHLITAEELHNYVRDAVEEFARITEGHTQVPQMTGRGAVGVVLGRTNRPPEACFSVTPEEPYAFGETQFVDESTDDGEIVEWMWDFGDGSTSNTEHAMHVFEREGTYTVTLTVTDDQGAVSSLAQDVLIQRAGEVTASSGDTVIISLGSVNGVEVGDPFDVLRVMTLSTGQVIEEYKAHIEVVELLDRDRAACRIDDMCYLIEIHDDVRPSQ